MSAAADRIEASVDVAASCERVFEVYAAVSEWPEWDSDLEGASIDGPFEAGSRGWIKPKDAPKLKTRLVDVQPGRSFTAESKLPGCLLRFHHQLESIATGGRPAQTRITHSIEFQGIGSGLLKRLLGPRMREAFPGAMAGLKAAVEVSG